MSAEEFFDCREAFAKAVEELAETDNRIVTVVNDSVGSSKLGNFRKRWPGRMVNVGIAEQNMVGVAAGLANGGKIPFVCGAACFLTGRALEQIKADVAYSVANVKLCGTTTGVAYGELGATHHSIEDIGWLRTLSGIVIIVPCDPWETAEAIKAAASHDGPFFIRVSRAPVPAIAHTAKEFRIGRAEVLRKGGDLAIISNGVVLHQALRAAEILAQEGIEARIINMPTVVPLDEDVVLEATETGAILTAEEHSVRGGLGGSIAEFTATRQPCAMRIMGFPGFLPTGSAAWLMERYGLTASGIVSAARQLVEQKR